MVRKCYVRECVNGRKKREQGGGYLYARGILVWGMPRKSPAKRLAESAVERWQRKEVRLGSIIRHLLANEEVKKALRSMYQKSHSNCKNNDSTEDKVDYLVSQSICDRIKETLHRIKYLERYSGVRKCIIAATLGQRTMSEVQRAFQV